MPPRWPSSSFALGRAFVVGSLLMGAGCGPAPDRRITPADLTPERIHELERDLDAAAAAERPAEAAPKR